MVDFYLHKYTTLESITQGIVAPHKYRHPVIKKMGMQQDCIKAWNKDKISIINNFINKLKSIYKENETFILFTPPTITKIFLDDIIKVIIQSFPNIIDLTYCFKKTSNVSFGDEKYNSYTIEQLAEFVELDPRITNQVDRKSNYSFILDDVFATGKSIELTKYLIKHNFNDNIVIKCGVILDTSK